jgi:predicted O-methyltransferase YrrM
MDINEYEKGEFVSSGHFYSVVPSATDRRLHVEKDKSSVTKLAGIDINHYGQISLLEDLKPYFDSCPFPDDKQNTGRYYYRNPAYSYGDALTLHSMIRYFSPKRIIEIGSGFSSAAMIDTNMNFFDSNISLTFIEPYPELLLSLMEDKDIQNSNIISSGVQEVNLELFDKLEQNDILFVDSTHVSKLNSDVNKIFFEIFPRLKPGVIIHIHDIFWPFEYPDDWIKQGRAWNELYILRALLQYSSGYEVLFFADYLRQMHFDWLTTNAPTFTKNTGGNFWMKKI